MKTETTKTNEQIKFEILFRLLRYRIAEIDESMMPLIKEAMEQYRSEGLREELIKFLSYYHFTINDEQKHEFLTTVVDEYLSNKQKP